MSRDILILCYRFEEQSVISRSGGETRVCPNPLRIIPGNNRLPLYHLQTWHAERATGPHYMWRHYLWTKMYLLRGFHYYPTNNQTYMKILKNKNVLSSKNAKTVLERKWIAVMLYSYILMYFFTTGYKKLKILMIERDSVCETISTLVKILLQYIRWINK